MFGLSVRAYSRSQVSYILIFLALTERPNMSLGMFRQPSVVFTANNEWTSRNNYVDPDRHYYYFFTHLTVYNNRSIGNFKPKAANLKQITTIRPA